MTKNSTPTRRTKRKTIVVLLALATVVVGAGAAFAYWTSGGSGTGTATTSAGTGTLTVVQTSSVTDLRPGGSPQPLSGHFDNDGTSPTYVGKITASIASVVGNGVCDATDYTLTHRVMVINTEVPVGTAQGAWGTTAGEIATIEFNNKQTINQDGCKGATITISYVVS